MPAINPKSQPKVTAWYEKELPDQSIYIGGRSYRFDLLETSDQFLIQHLDNAAKKHVGGIIKLTQEEYAQKKTNPSSASLRGPGKREEVRQKVVSNFQRRQRGASAAVEGKPEGSATPVQAVQDAASFVPQPVKGVFE